MSEANPEKMKVTHEMEFFYINCIYYKCTRKVECFGIKPIQIHGHKLGV